MTVVTAATGEERDAAHCSTRCTRCFGQSEGISTLVSHGFNIFKDFYSNIFKKLLFKVYK